MARNVSQTNWWEYWIPIWSNILQTRDLFNHELKDGYTKMFTNQNPTDSTQALMDQANSLSRTAYLEDREHTEMREDTAYQRAVTDMRKAGLNPYTIGASPAASSSSSANADLVSQRLQILGYILDLKNLDTKNRKVTNDAIGNILGFIKK